MNNKSMTKNLTLVLVLALALFFIVTPAINSSSGDITIFDGDSAYVENEYGKILVENNNHDGFVSHSHSINISWYNDSQYLDIAFKLSKETDRLWSNESVYVLRNYSHPLKTRVIGDVEYHIDCHGVFGTNYNVINSTTMWCNDSNLINAGNKTSYFENVYDRFINNETDARIYWNTTGLTGYTYPNISYFDWFDVTSSFTKVENGNYNYYFVKDIHFDKDETKQLKISYKAPLRSSGKFDVYLKRSVDTIQQAKDNDIYLLLDPSWGNSLDTDKFSYWTFNQTSGDIEDIFGGARNLTAQGGGGTYNQEGIINSSVHNLDDTGYLITGSTSESFNEMSVFGWVKSNGEPFDGNAKVWNFATSGAGGDELVQQSATSFVFNFYDDDDNLAQYSFSLVQSEWYHVGYAWNGTDVTYYINGTATETDSGINGSLTINWQTSAFGRRQFDSARDGNIGWDEFGIWNRTLTPSEVSDLYNSGNGLSPNQPDAPSVSLSPTPVDFANFTDIFVVLNCSSTSDTGILNQTLVIDGEDNNTIFNTTSTQLNISQQVNLSFIDGTHNWSCRAIDADNLIGTSATRTFNIDSINPVVAITFPLNQSYLTNVTWFNSTISDTNLDTCWWTQDSGDTNNTFGCGDNATGILGTDGDITLSIYANDTFGNTGSSVVTYSQNFATNTSYLGISVNIGDITISSATYVLASSFNFNTSSSNISFGFLNSMQIEKQSGGQTNDVYMNVSIDGLEVFEGLLRTVSGTAEPGVAGSDPFGAIVEFVGEHLLNIFFRRTGNGGVGISNIDFSMGRFETTEGFTGRGNTTTFFNSFSSTNPVTVFSKTLEKGQNASTHLAAIIKVNSTLEEIPVCRFVDGNNSAWAGVTTPAGNGVRSISMTYITTPENNDENISIECFSTGGNLVGIEGTINEADMRDSDGNIINHLYMSNPNTNWTNTLTFNAGTNLIIEEDFTIQNGSNVLISFQTSTVSLTGDQIPTYVVNVTNSTGAEVFNSLKVRSTSGDIGNTYFYPVSEGLIKGQTYTIAAHVNVSAGEQLEILDEEINLFENSPFDTATINTPIQITITNPTNGSEISGVINITWITSDPQGDDYTTNITFANESGKFTIASGLVSSISNFSYNTTALFDGIYNLTGISNENDTADEFVATDAIVVTINNLKPVVELTSPTNNNVSTNLSQIFLSNVTSSSAGLVNMTIEVYNSTDTIFTNTSLVGGFFNTSSFNHTFLAYENLTWNVQSCDINGDCQFAESNYSLNLTNVAPVFNTTNPANHTNSTSLTQTFSANLTSNDELSNITFTIFNETGDIENVTTTSISGTTNDTSLLVTISSFANYVWNFVSCDVFGLCSTAGNFSLNTYEGNITLNNLTNEGNNTLAEYITLTANLSLSENNNVSDCIFNIDGPTGFRILNVASGNSNTLSDIWTSTPFLANITGNYSSNVTCTDRFGASYHQNSTFVVDYTFTENPTSVTIAAQNLKNETNAFNITAFHNSNGSIIYNVNATIEDLKNFTLVLSSNQIILNDSTLDANNTARVELTFNASNDIANGSYTGNVTFTNSTFNESFIVTFSYGISPPGGLPEIRSTGEIVCDPTKSSVCYNEDPIRISESDTFSYNVNNTGLFDISMCNAQFSGSLGSADWVSFSDSNFSIAQNGSQLVTITFAPTAGASTTVDYDGYLNVECANGDLLGNNVSAIPENRPYTIIDVDEAPAPVTPPSGGGGSTTTIIQDGDAQWIMTTDTLSKSYQFSLAPGTTKKRGLLFENLGSTARAISLSCQSVNNSLDVCPYLTFEEDNFILPVEQERKIRKTFDVTVPRTINDGIYKGNILAMDGAGRTDVVTIEVNIGIGTSRVTSKLTSSKSIFSIPIPYWLIGLMVWIFVALLIALIFNIVKIKFGGAVGIVVGLIVAVLVVIYL